MTIYYLLISLDKTGFIFLRSFVSNEREWLTQFLFRHCIHFTFLIRDLWNEVYWLLLMFFFSTCINGRRYSFEIQFKSSSIAFRVYSKSFDLRPYRWIISLGATFEEKSTKKEKRRKEERKKEQEMKTTSSKPLTDSKHSTFVHFWFMISLFNFRQELLLLFI